MGKPNNFLKCTCHDAFWSEFLDEGLKEVKFPLSSVNLTDATTEAKNLWQKIKERVLLDPKENRENYFADWGHFNPRLIFGDSVIPLC